MKFRVKTPTTNKGIGRVTTLLFLCAVVAFNVLIYALSTRFSWYFYTAERFTHTIGDVNEEKIAALSHPVSVRFCMAEEDLEKEVAYSLVYNTAKQYAEKYDTVTLLDSYNIYTDFRAVAAYREKTGAAISSSAVIIESDVETRVLTLSDFFHLDSANRIQAYNGEEVFLSMFYWVQAPAAEHPTVYFTRDHGENYAIPGLSLQLIMAGYQLDTVELSLEAIPDGAAFVVISNPLYDFDRASEAATVKSELDRLADYLDGGGKLYVTFDAGSDAYAGLTNLREFLSFYGIEPEDGVLTDYENGLTVDGKTMVVAYPASGAGAAFAATVTAVNPSRIVTRDTAALTLDGENPKGAAVYPVLLTADTAETPDGHTGVYPVAAFADLLGGGKIFCSGGGYIAYGELVNTQSYANETLLYRTAEAFGCTSAPIGCTTYPFAASTLENVTVGESNRVFICLSAVLPAVTLSLCAVRLIRRKRR